MGRFDDDFKRIRTLEPDWNGRSDETPILPDPAAISAAESFAPQLDFLENVELRCCVNGIVKFLITYPGFRHLAVLFGAEEDRVEASICVLLRGDGFSFYGHDGYPVKMGEGWESVIQSWLRTYLNIPPCLEIVQSPNPTDEEIARVKVTMRQLRDMGDWHCPLLIVRAADGCNSQSLLRALLVELDPCCDPQAWLGLYGRLRAHMPTGGAMDGSEAWLRRLRRDCYAIPLTRAFLEDVPYRVANSDAADVPLESIRLFEEFYPSVLERDDYRAEPTIDMMGGLACGLWAVPVNKYGMMTLWFGEDGVSLTAIDRDTLHVDHHHVVRDIAHLNSLLDDLIG